MVRSTVFGAACAVIAGVVGATALAQDRIAPQSAGQVKLSFAPVVAQSAPAVVNVYSRRVVASRARSPFADDPFFRFFNDDFFGPRERVEQSLGSGVIVRNEGVIVTNSHVVEGALELRVVLNDRREFDAELILADERTDLAVLRINPGDEILPALPIAGTDDLAVGDLVLAIGNPFGVGQTVTNGIVSAVGRSAMGVSDFGFFIQTDAAINPGNSGGALVDLDGALVGVNTAIFSRSGGSNGIGFAIPGELVERVVESALEDGRIVRPWLGARGRLVTRDLAASLDLDRPQGVLIEEIYPRGPADQAGLERGDVILRVGDTDVNADEALRFQLATYRVGQEARLAIWRDGRERRLDLPLAAPVEDPPRDRRTLSGRHPLQGAVVGNLSPAFNTELGLDPMLRGVAVLETERGSAARYYGFRPGDIILALNDADVDTARDLDRIASRFADARTWTLVIARGGQRTTVRLRF